MIAKKAKKKSGIDYRSCSPDVVCQVLAISKTTLQNWRKSGAPFRKEGRTVRYSVPDLVDWRREQDVAHALERRNTGGKADMEADKADLSDVDLAKRSLRELMMSGGDIARVQAAKATISTARPEAPKDEIPVISFIEIENIDSVIQAVGVSTPCPECGAVVRLQMDGANIS